MRGLGFKLGDFGDGVWDLTFMGQCLVSRIYHTVRKVRSYSLIPTCTTFLRLPDSKRDSNTSVSAPQRMLDCVVEGTCFVWGEVGRW